MRRFYINQNLANQAGPLTLKDRELTHQLKKVLRLSTGDLIYVFGNDGLEAEAVIDRITDTELDLSLQRIYAGAVPKKELQLAVAIVKRDKFEWLVEKGTELGISGFQPLITDRVVKTGLKLERLEKIAREAAEQCGRSNLPDVTEPQELRDWLAAEANSSGSIVVLDRSAQQDLNQQSNEPMTVLIGPEGGWSDEERRIFQNHRLPFRQISRWNLKTETAALAAACLYLDPGNES